MMSEFGHIEAIVNKTKDSHACLKYVQICQLAFSKVCVSVILLSKAIGRGFFPQVLSLERHAAMGKENNMGEEANYVKKYCVCYRVIVKILCPTILTSPLVCDWFTR